MYKVVQVFETVEKVLKYDHQKLKQFSRILLNGSFIMQYTCIFQIFQSVEKIIIN